MLSGAMQKVFRANVVISGKMLKIRFLAQKWPKLAQNGPRFHTPPRVHKISQLLFHKVFDSMKYLVRGAKKLNGYPETKIAKSKMADKPKMAAKSMIVSSNLGQNLHAPPLGQA